jgi:hypothetical protein
MWFGEQLPFPERGSPTRLSTLGQPSWKGWSCKKFCFNKTAYSFLYSCFVSAFLCGVLEEHTFKIIMHKTIEVHRCFISRQPFDGWERKKPHLNRRITANLKVPTVWLIILKHARMAGRQVKIRTSGFSNANQESCPLVSLIRYLYIFWQLRRL